MNWQNAIGQPQIRCGTDLVEIDRISRAVTRLGQPFLDRIWTKAEQADCLLPDSRLTAAAAASLAARFAAKEAVSKALGTGFGPSGVRWTDIAVQKLPGGVPRILLHGAALTVFKQLGGQSIAISLTHERTLALAFCVLTCQSATPAVPTDPDKEMFDE
jgi:holo-[acyl-carrier protein] synthase